MVHYEVNIFSIGLMLIILVSFNLRKELKSNATTFFKYLIVFTILVLTIESVTFMVDKLEGDTFKILNFASNFLVILFAPIIPGLWASYIDYKIHGSIERVQKRLFYMYPFLIGAILSVLNIFTPVLFRIDNFNVYHREPFIWVNMLTSFILLMYTLFLTLANRKSITRNILVSVVAFSFFPFIAAVIQISSTGLVLVWGVTSLGVVLSYLMLETQSNSIDFLTGLYTRVMLDEYVKRLIRKEKFFSVIMIDLDDFKHINDTYGHQTGDKLLVKFGHVLNDVFTNSMVSRYGGDEFIVVMLETKDNIIKAYIDQVHETISRSDEELVKITKFSAGYTKRTKDKALNFETLLTESDNLMYEEKALNKNQKRRKDDQ